MARISDLNFRDFGGGLNLRDAASELSPNEFPLAQNITVDERGYVEKRLGYIDRYGAQIGSGLVSNIFHWATKGFVVEQIGTSVHINNSSSFKTFSTNARIGMTEYAGNLFMIHPVDGCFIYDGTTVTAVPTGPKGNSCSTWQNKVWCNDFAVPSRLWFSDLGTATNFTGTNFVDLREKDSSQITLLTGASGVDISGRPGLLAFKEDSAYRVNDSTTGAYSTIDPSVGCGSNIGAITAYGRTFVASTRGIYSTDGLNPMREDSLLLEPLFSKDKINQTRPDLYCAGKYQDRLYFSIPSVGNNYNSIAIEFHPISGWMTLHTNAASCYGTIGRAVTDLVFGSPTLNGRIYNFGSTGADAGVAITSIFQTRWAEPAGGRKSRLRQARFTGRGTFSADVLKDYYDSSTQAALPVSISPGGAIWDDPGSTWDTSGDLWGPLFFQGFQDFFSLGVCRAVSIKITETSSVSIQGREINGVAIEKGNFSLGNIDLLAFDLGIYYSALSLIAPRIN
jgi:hypothetical protein